MSKKNKPKPGASSKRDQNRPFNNPFSGLGDRVPAPEPALQRPAPPRPQSPPVNEDPDEALTFERFMAGVVPLGTQPSARVPTSETVASSLPKRAAAPTHDPDQEARMRLHALVEEGSRFEVVDDGRMIEGRRRGVDGRQVRRMKHGELPVDATLDLHGMRSEQAHEAVEAFVRDRRSKGDKVVVIVHGRGLNSPRGQSILRGEVGAWLSEGKASQHVAAFVTAPQEHGGEGAMCVLLTQASHRV